MSDTTIKNWTRADGKLDETYGYDGYLLQARYDRETGELREVYPDPEVEVGLANEGFQPLKETDLEKYLQSNPLKLGEQIYRFKENGRDFLFIRKSRFIDDDPSNLSNSDSQLTFYSPKIAEDFARAIAYLGTFIGSGSDELGKQWSLEQVDPVESDGKPYFKLQTPFDLRGHDDSKLLQSIISLVKMAKKEAESPSDKAKDLVLHLEIGTVNRDIVIPAEQKGAVFQLARAVREEDLDRVYAEQEDQINMAEGYWKPTFWQIHGETAQVAANFGIVGAALAGLGFVVKKLFFNYTATAASGVAEVIVGGETPVVASRLLGPTGRPLVLSAGRATAAEVVAGGTATAVATTEVAAGGTVAARMAGTSITRAAGLILAGVTLAEPALRLTQGVRTYGDQERSDGWKALNLRYKALDNIHHEQNKYWDHWTGDVVSGVLSVFGKLGVGLGQTFSSNYDTKIRAADEAKISEMAVTADKDLTAFVRDTLLVDAATRSIGSDSEGRPSFDWVHFQSEVRSAYGQFSNVTAALEEKFNDFWGTPEQYQIAETLELKDAVSFQGEITDPKGLRVPLERSLSVLKSQLATRRYELGLNNHSEVADTSIRDEKFTQIHGKIRALETLLNSFDVAG